MREGHPVNQTNIGQPFLRRHWANFWETGWSAYGIFRAHRYQLELIWTAFFLTCQWQTLVSFSAPFLSPNSAMLSYAAERAHLISAYYFVHCRCQLPLKGMVLIRLWKYHARKRCWCLFAPGKKKKKKKKKRKEEEEEEENVLLDSNRVLVRFICAGVTAMWAAINEASDIIWICCGGS